MTKEARTVEDDINDALTEIEGGSSEDVKEEEVEVEAEVEEDVVEKTEENEEEEGVKALKEPSEDDTGEEEEAEAEDTLVVEEAIVEQDLAPRSWSGLQKEKWADIPKETRDYIKQREDEFHQAITKHDDERLFGKTVREQFTPYMPIIEAEGGTPEGAIKDYLQMSYVLRQGTPDQKANIIRSAIQQFNIDPQHIFGQQNQGHQQVNQGFDNQALLKLQELEQKLSEKEALSEKTENDKILSEVQAFELDPANIYYNDVKLEMAALLKDGLSDSLEDAYEKAIWAHPEIRAGLIAKKEATAKAERKKQLDAKKKAASSVTGSPDKKSVSSPKTTGKYVDPTDSVEEAFKALQAGDRA